MDVYLVQHGQAVSEAQDAQRPLSEEGRAVAAKVARHLAARAEQLVELPISEVRHSGKLRAGQTAEVLAQCVCPEVTPTGGNGMKPADDPYPVYDELAARRDEAGAILLVGHLPHLARLAGLLLTGDADKTPVRLTNAAVLKLTPAEGAWSVAWYLTPACVG